MAALIKPGIILPRGYRRPNRPALDPTHPLSRGLLGYWLLGDAVSGVAVDLGPGGLHGAIVGSPPLTSSHHGGAAQSLNGSSQYATTGINMSGRATGSISWWQKPSTAFNSSSPRVMWSSLLGSVELSCQVFSDNNWYVGWSGPASDTRITFAASSANYPQAWSNYVFDWDSSGSRLYLNDALIGSTGTAPILQTFTDVMYFGKQSTLPAYFPGSLEGLRVYNRVLSSAERYQLYAEPYAGVFDAGVQKYLVGAASAGPSGSAAWTEAADTWAGAGAVAIAGTAAWTETKDGWSATGGIVGTGTAAWTEAADTWSATGTVTTGPSGAVAWTEAADSWAATGGVVISGTVSWTETKDTWAISGSITLPGVSGSAAWTEGPDVWAGLGNNGLVWTPETTTSVIWTPATLATTPWTPQ